MSQISLLDHLVKTKHLLQIHYQSILDGGVEDEEQQAWAKKHKHVLDNIDRILAELGYPVPSK